VERSALRTPGPAASGYAGATHTGPRSAVATEFTRPDRAVDVHEPCARIDRRAERGLGPRYALCLDLRD
jgi:hypothetical protein